MSEGLDQTVVLPLKLDHLAAGNISMKVGPVYSYSPVEVINVIVILRGPVARGGRHEPKVDIWLIRTRIKYPKSRVVSSARENAGPALRECTHSSNMVQEPGWDSYSTRFSIVVRV